MSGGEPRVPSPPEAVRGWMERFGGSPIEAGAEPLTEAAIRALEAALQRPGKDREGAYALLAADGLVTYAVEEMAESEDPAADLDALVRRIAAMAERGDG